LYNQKFIEKMKEKIKSALKTEYAKMGLSERAFDGVASFLAKTISNEEEISGVITNEDTKNLLKAFQGESDSLRNRAAQLEKDFNAYKEKHPETPDTPPTPPKGEEQEPEWAKKLREQNEAILKRQQEEDAARALKAQTDSIEAKLKAAGCTNPGILKATLKGFSLAKDETEDAAIERLKGEYNNSYKETFGDGPAPLFGGAPQGGDAKDAVDRKNAFLRSQGLLPEQK